MEFIHYSEILLVSTYRFYYQNKVIIIVNIKSVTHISSRNTVSQSD